MNPQRSAILASACYPAVVIAAWAVVSLTGIGSPHIEASAAAHVVDRLAPALAASVEMAAPLQPAAMNYAAVSKFDVAAATEQPLAIAAPSGEPRPMVVAALTDPADVVSAEVPPVPVKMADRLPPEVAAVDKSIASVTQAGTTAVPGEPQPIVVATLTDPLEILPLEIPLAPASAAGATELPPQDVLKPYSRIELVGECQVSEACIDQFLWTLYQRTPKEDTIKEHEQRKVTIKRRGKMVTVTRTFTKLVENDFTWKDPNAAERVAMPIMDYVIGGMDRSFKLKLFHMLYAAEAAGLQPGITSAFRDDYRQGIASGLKAASNRSYHGGSLRGGYGRGLAADIVSVNGTSRAKRWVSTEALWKWVDANGKQFGIGRPYLAYDPPHVGPIDGPEYASRRGGTKTAAADVKKRQKQVAQAKPAAAKRAVTAKPPRGKPASQLAAAR